MLLPADVEQYWRIRNNPFHRDGFRMEDAIVYCDEIRHELARLDERSQFILQAEAAGFTQREMAAICGVPWRTMVRWIAKFRDAQRFDA